MKSLLLAAMLGISMIGAAKADGSSTVYEYNGSFGDATFSVESAIVGKGLVIDYVSHTGEMLNRTGADVGSQKKLFDEADIFVFCSAVVSRKVMEIDPANIAHCPYGIFVAERDGKVTVGYRNYPKGAMQQVQVLLDEIVKEAVGK